MGFTAMRIDHVEVFVTDMERSIRWYNEVLGLEEKIRWDPEPVMIGVAGNMLALFRANGTRPDHQEEVHWHRVAWHTDREGFTRAQEQLKEMGIVFRGPVDHGIADSIYFADPDGNPLEITWYKKRVRS